MPKLKTYTARTLSRYLDKRPGETKLGEKLTCLAAVQELKEHPADLVLIGIPEDIGVRANYGIPGTSRAWEAFLKAFLNIQHNQFLKAENVLILGEIDCSQEMNKAALLDGSDPNYYIKLGELVSRIDSEVSSVVGQILSAGKTPIIIGGGHNNSYGNLAGAATALGSPINALNIDAHTDLRQLEHRHSGNGFSYAREKGFLKAYAVFGLQQNYTPQYIYEKANSSDELAFYHFEELQVAGNLQQRFTEAVGLVNSRSFGLEIDCDAIAGFPSSAASPSGFSLDEIRKLIRIAATDPNCVYLHLCEASVREDFATGKALSFLTSDFIKSRYKNK